MREAARNRSSPHVAWPSRNRCRQFEGSKRTARRAACAASVVCHALTSTNASVACASARWSSSCTALRPCAIARSSRSRSGRVVDPSGLVECELGTRESGIREGVARVGLNRLLESVDRRRAARERRGIRHEATLRRMHDRPRGSACRGGRRTMCRVEDVSAPALVSSRVTSSS